MENSENLKCFKAYDVRGRLPDELNEKIAYKIGRAFATVMKPAHVVVGFDVRDSSKSLTDALSKGLLESGVDVFNIGLCGTEEIYFATFFGKYDGGIMVTASHNPIDYNGMKFVKSGSRPISSDDGLNEIKEVAESGKFAASENTGILKNIDLKDDYIKHLLGYVEVDRLKPLKIVVNAGNGCAGPIVDLLEKNLPFEFIRVNHIPDGSFPNGIPNPLLPENRSSTSEAVISSKADFGIAWDGDFDRCFLFDENGEFIEGYYIVGLLGVAFLKRFAGAKIIHDPRLTWNTIELVAENGGQAVMSKTGHAFIKDRMRKEDAVYGGEMSAHHYFKDFAYCDSGMIPWLLVSALISEAGQSLGELVKARMEAFPASGEINRKVENPGELISKVKKLYSEKAIKLDETDGLSLEFEDWRLNLRMSNTEPLLRLNVESRGNQELMKSKTSEILKLLD